MKVKNKTIEHLEIRLDDFLNVREIIKNTYNVLGENKERLVIDNSWFSSVDTVKAKRGHTQFNQLVGEVKVRDYVKDKYFKSLCGSYVVTVYHFGKSNKILQNQINKAVDKYIDNKIGCYFVAGRCNIKLN